MIIIKNNAHPTPMVCEFLSNAWDDAVTQNECHVQSILFFISFVFGLFFLFSVFFLREGIEGGDKWYSNLFKKGEQIRKTCGNMGT